jgi:hypothetical protein
MSEKRQKSQLVLAFTEEGRSEAPKASQEGTASRTAKRDTERPARELAAQTGGSPHGPWRVANSPALSIALPLAYFDSFGLPRLSDGFA